MSRKGRTFEKKYEWLYKLDKKYKVTSPEYLFDKAAGIKREVDVLVEYCDSNGFDRKIAIECRDRKGKEDVTWIEQLVQKREDLGIDCLIATTTKSFSEAAIAKAKTHGVVIEQAEYLSEKNVYDNTIDFFLDIFFCKFDLLKFDFCLLNKKKKSFKKFFSDLDFSNQNELMYFINTDFYFSFDPQTIFDDYGIKKENFFSSEDNSIELKGNSLLVNSPLPSCMKNVLFFDWAIRIVPYRITLPIINSISTFDGENRSNKNYRAEFNSDEDYFRIGYLNEKVFLDFGIKKREYLRFLGMNLELNTIIPENTNREAFNISEEIFKNYLGGFDFRNIE